MAVGFRQVTLIEKNAGFQYHTIGALRACVDANFAPQVLIPLSHVLRHGRVVQGEVVDIGEKEVRLASGETYPFDALVLATGSVSGFPVTTRAARKMMDSLARFHAVFLS